MKYKIYYGLGGSFGGCKRNPPEVLEFSSQEEADTYAYEMAVQEYQSYEGLHGLRGPQEIMDEDGVSEEDMDEAYAEEMDSWLDYFAEPLGDEK